MIIPSHTGLEYNRSDLISKIGDKIINHYQKDSRLHLREKIYISRLKASYRKVKNKDKVINKLKAYGFAEVTMEVIHFWIKLV